MVIYGILTVLFIWCILLTVILFSTRGHYLKLISKTKKEHLDEILEKLIADHEGDKKNFKKLEQVLSELNEKEQFHLQKTALLGFNPFERTGGEQSFVIAFLDKKNNGLLINYIYTRDGLRTYAKRIKEGKGEQYELSREEKRAIEQSK